MSELFDVAVIGGGPAGYVAAIRSAQLGGKVILFEKEKIGGTCLNRGCIPTKSFVKTGEKIDAIKKASERGIVTGCEKPAVNIKRVVDFKNEIVKKLTGGVSSLLKSNGVTVIPGEAFIEDENTVVCEGKEYRTDKIIICTGSKAITEIPGINREDVITSDEMLNLDYLPQNLVIIGGGIIGCEFAQPFGLFGSKVTVIESAERLCSGLDPELSDGIKKGLEKSGVRVITSAKVEKICSLGSKKAVYVAGEELHADTVLLCIGRTPSFECSPGFKGKLEMAGNYIKTDDHCMTSVKNVFACGDVTPSGGLASDAMKMGEIAAENAMGRNAVCDLSKSPKMIHSIPEAASVGLGEAEARKQYGDNLIIGRFPFSANGMCLASDMTDGFIKILAEKKYGEIIGIHILGANATEMASEAEALMSMEIPVYEAAGLLHAHPTMSEGLIEAFNDTFNMSIHLPKKK